MRIKIDELPEDGVEVEVDGSEPWARKPVEEAVEGPLRHLAANLHVGQIAELVRVSGEAESTSENTCNRCGGTVEIDLGGQVELLYEPTPHHALTDELITDEADLDIGYFDGKALELGDVLGEQFALWLPPAVRCGDPGVRQVGEPWECRLPDQEPGPDLTRHKPFAKLRLPD